MPIDAVVRGGYDPNFFDHLAGIEDQHFWFRARNRLILRLVKNLARELPPGFSVLEVGCGTGNVLRVLRRACPSGTVVGLELCFEGLQHAKRRSLALLVQGDVRAYPFAKPFSLICMFDVLEHVPNEHSTLTSLYNNLAPGGKLLLTVPAHQFLWSYFDEAAHHCRRYSLSEIRQKLSDAGFEIEFAGQFMACLFPLVWLVRKFREPLDSDPSAAHVRSVNEFRIIPIVNEFLTALLTIEALWVARRRHLPLGTSLVVIARKST